MKNKRGKTMYKETEVNVEIEIDDVIRFISHYASDSELESIAQATIKSGVDSISDVNLFDDRGMEGSMVRTEKLELLSAAFRRFSLEELESLLGGTKYSL